MEPTTWTPERALEMFRDWDDPDLTMHEFCEKWYIPHNPDDFAKIAIEALESAAAEVERQKARADGLAAIAERNGKAATERGDLLARCGRAVGLEDDDDPSVQPARRETEAGSI